MTDMSSPAVLARHVEQDGRCAWCGGQQWPCDAFTEHDLAEQATALRDELLVQHVELVAQVEAARAGLARTRERLARLVASAVLVPMEREDDDDGPAEFWCVHPEPLEEARAILDEQPPQDAGREAR